MTVTMITRLAAFCPVAGASSAPMSQSAPTGRDSSSTSSENTLLGSTPASINCEAASRWLSEALTHSADVMLSILLEPGEDVSPLALLLEDADHVAE